MKNYKAQGGNCTFIAIAVATVAAISLLALLSWLSEKDHQAKLEQIARAAQCEVKL